MADWGPHNPHPLSRMKTELVWEGKYDEYGNRRPVHLPDSPLPLQRIETIDAPRDARKAMARQLGLPFEEEAFHQQAHQDDFRNMLIWGDNKLAMASLLEEFRGKVDLIYIDPPFDVGADFTMQVQIGEEGGAVQKEQSILEAVAYRDTWGKGTDSYLHMMYERLTLMRDLLSERGSIYVHCDWRVSYYLRAIMDDVFGVDNFLNNIAWCYKTRQFSKQYWNRKHDEILYYHKGSEWIFNWDVEGVIEPYSDTTIKKYKYRDDIGYYRLSGRGIKGSPIRSAKDVDPEWEKSHPELVVREYLGTGYAPSDYWLIDIENQASNERTDFATQKPSALLRKIILASSNEGDLVADFFCGSGTTMAVAEKLGRRWIGVDLGRYAIHTTRKRLIQVQRELHAGGRPYRSFDVYNLGRYERQWWQLERLKGADGEHRRVVLRFYKAAPFGVLEPSSSTTSTPSPLLHGKKNGAYVHVDEIDGIFTFDKLRAVAQAVQAVGGSELHCLAWEFEMELGRRKEATEAEYGLVIRLKYIPREIMEPNRTEVQFFEAGVLEARPIWSAEEGHPHSKASKVDVELVHFMPALAEAPERELEALRERAVKSPFDFIDFWAVDFDYAPDKPFEHHWQDFRTRKDRSLKTRTDVGWTYETAGRHQIAVKVIDVFGVDTTIVLDVEC